MLRTALRGERNSDVPCGGCTACCTSSQFIHVGPDEVDTLARIPKHLLFAAPLLPDGYMVMGYDERGHCPMLEDNRCTIYAHRPRACRTYDCRVLPAAGLHLDEPERVRIRQQTDRWQFSFETPTSEVQHDAVRAAAAFLVTRAREFATGTIPSNTTQLAVAALAIHELFLAEETDGSPRQAPTVDMVRAVLERPS